MKRPFKICIVIAAALAGVLLCTGIASATLVYTESGWVEDDSIDTSWFDFQNVKSEYTISTEAELRGLANLVNEEQYMWKPNRTESFEDVTFVLTRDISLTDAWTPIGIDEQITFSGTLDGKGHSITGLQVTSEDPYSGLFGHLSGTVRNLELEGSVNSTADYCGGVAGYVDKDAVVHKCRSNVQVAGRNDVGGIAGYNRGTISGCINFGEVIGASMVGGIVGESRGGTIKYSGNRGLIVSNGAGSFNNGTGGVAGQSVSASSIRRCYNVGDILSSNEATGGVAGYTNSTGSSITNCYSIGSIRIEEPQVQTTAGLEPAFNPEENDEQKAGEGLPVYAGGIAGYVGSENLAIRNCYNAGSITGADYAGGIIGKCQNEVFSSSPPAFVNNYYGKGSFDGAIAADRNNKRMKVRGAASEVYDSAFGHLSGSLGDAYMDDKAGDYGSRGYPVLTWQEQYQSAESLAVLKHIDPKVLQWLHEANLALETRGFRHGRSFLNVFNLDVLYQNNTADKPALPIKEKKEK